MIAFLVGSALFIGLFSYMLANWVGVKENCPRDSQSQTICFGPVGDRATVLGHEFHRQGDFFWIAWGLFLSVSGPAAIVLRTGTGTRWESAAVIAWSALACLGLFLILVWAFGIGPNPDVQY